MSSAKRGSAAASAPRVPLGGDYWQADPGVPLWGLADLHAHLMAHLAFGGKAFWGQPYDADHSGDTAMQQVLGSCAPIHGGLFNVNPEFGHVPGGGWPDFNIWPRFTTLVHQQSYVDWLYRAYQGGLRLITCLAVNNELLASKTNPGAQRDDRDAIATQVSAMKAMAAWIDAQAGGPGKGWMAIAYTPEDAQQIIGANKLAVILGVEVDSLGNWHHAEDLDRLAGGDPDKTRRLIGLELDWLYELGIRQVTPIHLANNAFGGTAIYIRFLELANVFITGEPWAVEDAFGSGVRYRLDQDGADLKSEIERRIAGLGPGFPQQPRLTMNRMTLIDALPGLEGFADHALASGIAGSHANSRGLHPYGGILLEEMMKRGMIIDIDHMSQKTADAALDLAEQHTYPVISSHGSFRELAYTANEQFAPEHDGDFGTGDVHKLPHEAMKPAEQVERIRRLGGLIAPILNQGDIAGLRQGLPELAGKVRELCAGSSTSWAQAYVYAVAKMGGQGVAIGSDVNGAAALPGPRFGTAAAYGAGSDTRRIAQRRGEIDRQQNGVRYDRPVRDYRWFRFDDSGPGAYDEAEREAWVAIAQYKAGFNPAKQGHPADDFPAADLLNVLNRLELRLDQERIDNITKGLWAAEQAQSQWEVTSWPTEQRAAYLARRGTEESGLAWDPFTLAMADQVAAIWARWEAMEGDNAPLARCTAGPRRDWDINIDGMAHYGLLPDFLQDLRNVGLAAEDLAPLFRSAYDYVQMWGKCVSRSLEITAASPAARAVAGQAAGVTTRGPARAARRGKGSAKAEQATESSVKQGENSRDAAGTEGRKGKRGRKGG